MFWQETACNMQQHQVFFRYLPHRVSLGTPTSSHSPETGVNFVDPQFSSLTIFHPDKNEMTTKKITEEKLWWNVLALSSVNRNKNIMVRLDLCRKAVHVWKWAEQNRELICAEETVQLFWFFLFLMKTQPNVNTGREESDKRTTHFVFDVTKNKTPGKMVEQLPLTNSYS